MSLLRTLGCRDGGASVSTEVRITNKNSKLKRTLTSVSSEVFYFRNNYRKINFLHEYLRQQHKAQTIATVGVNKLAGAIYPTLRIGREVIQTVIEW